MLPSSIIRAAQKFEPFDFARNPYKAKQRWPPDFEKLSDKYQFRLERRYRRRSKLKWARPQLMKATKLAQWFGCTAVVVYGVLFMKWGDGREAFTGVRQWYRHNAPALLGGSSSRTSSQIINEPTPR